MFAKMDGCQHEYIEVLKQKKQYIQYEYLQTLKKNHPNVQPYSLDALKTGCDFLINASLEFNGLAADCPVLAKVETDSETTQYYYEPTIFIETYGCSANKNNSEIAVATIKRKKEKLRNIVSPYSIFLR